MALRVEAVVHALDGASTAMATEHFRQHDAEKIDQAAEAGQGDDQVDPVAFLAAAYHMQTTGDLAGQNEQGE